MRRALLAVLALAACKREAKPVADTTGAAVIVAPTPMAAPPAPVSGVDTVVKGDTTHYVYWHATPTVDSTQTSVKPAYATGLPFGLTSLPDVPPPGLTGTDKGESAKAFLKALQDAAKAHVRQVINMPRTAQTENGQLSGNYSVKRTWAAVDELMQTVPRDSMLKYLRNGTLLGYRIMDDMGCLTCWGANGPVTVYQVDSVYQYARATLWPEMPIGIRVHPTWIKKLPTIAKNVDFFYLQYVDNKGDIKTWYDKETAYAKTLQPVPRILYAINFNKPYRQSPTVSITAADLQKWGTLAVTYPGNCLVSGFYFWSGWRDAGRGPVWDSLAALAKRQTPTPADCGRLVTTPVVP